MSDERPCCTDTPDLDRANPPGQPTLRTRVGTHGRFRASMIAALSSQIVPPDGSPTDPRPLRALTTRGDDDGTIALIDAWATACDVLAFYGERILNETYLGTATQRVSVVEIAEMLGYTPSPGVAAGTRLALTVQASAQVPDGVDLDAGIAVMSLPPAGELPQTFETVEALFARPEWNTLTPRQTLPESIDAGGDAVWLDGVGQRLEVGQAIVIDGHIAHVVGIALDPANARSRVAFLPALPLPFPTAPEVVVFRHTGGLFGWNAPDYRSMNAELKASFLETPGTLDLEITVAVDSEITGIAYAVPWVAWSLTTDWPNIGLSSDDGWRGAFDLERETDKIAPGSQVYLEDGSSHYIGEVASTEVRSRREWTLVGKVSHVVLTADVVGTFQRRSTRVHYGSEVLAVAEAPLTTVVSGTRMVLDTEVPEMEVGRTLLVCGVADETDEDSVIEVQVTGWDQEGDRSVIVVADVLPALQRDTVTIHGNTAAATHGEAVTSEVLGSADARMPHARFPLRSAPLTWVSAATPSGAEATLELRIGGVLWDRVDSLFSAGPHDRVYVIEQDQDGNSIVVLGDGVRGARAPTGQDNVVATYRQGIGLGGEVGAELLTLLKTRPLGLFGATNPAGASGGADPEALEDARRNAPLTVLTLDRLVSLSDYEDYARAFPGIGKSRASQLWDGRRSSVHLTVASASGQVFSPDDTVITSLQDAIAALGDPTHVVRIDPHQEVAFRLAMALAVDDAYVREDVEASVRSALGAAFAFEARGFGQPVPLSEVAAVVHEVEGVIAVDIDALHRDGAPPAPNPVLRAALATWTGQDVSRAELLILDPTTIEIVGMVP